MEWLNGFERMSFAESDLENANEAQRQTNEREKKNTHQARAEETNN